MNWMEIGALIGLLCSVAAQGSDVSILGLSDCETLDGWGRSAQLVSPGHRGEFAAAADMPAGEPGFLQFNFAQTGVDLATAHALAFWWKVEGKGLVNLMVKVRNYPLADGMEAVYRVWDTGMGTPPQAWQRAVISLAHPDFDDWGERPEKDARYITFRTQTTADTKVRLFLDDLIALPPTLEWEVEPRHLQNGAWEAGVTLHNLTSNALSVVVGTGTRHLLAMTVPAQARQSRPVSLPVDSEAFDRLEPLAGLSVPLWTEVDGVPETRMERRVKLMKPLKLPPPPRLLLNREGVEQLKARIQQYEWAGARWRSLQRQANQLLEEPVELPPRGGNWWHWYACPTHGAPLKTGKQIGKWQWEHICPIDGEVFHGDATHPERDYDGVVISGRHSHWSQAVRTLGIVYQVTGDRRYAEKARDILLAYAERYPDYPLHTIRGEAKIGGGRVGPQTLDESTWLIPFCQGADLVWETLSGPDRERIAQSVLQPAAREVILPHRMGVHNIQCWKNSAVGLVGFLLDDAELLHEAIHDPERGYWRQMEKGVLPDGIWWEGAWGYHFYTLSALWSLTEAARNCGVDLYGDALKKMFDAPLIFAMPNLHLPAFNDSGEVDLGGQAAMYELAYARYGEPRYLTLLNRGDRQNDFALWFGEGDLPAAPPMQWTSANYTDSGYTILSHGAGDAATWLCLKYGPHGGGHGHPDKLNFILYARGGVIAPDPGTARYGVPIQGGWYRTTLAHNTLIVDGNSQRAAEGKCLAFGQEGGVDFVMADAGEIYEGVHFVRNVALLTPNLLLFIDCIRCDQEHLLEVAYHQRGRWEQLPDGEAWTPPDEPGYRYLRDGTMRQTADGVGLTTRVREDWNVAITLAGGESTEIITATGVGHHAEDRVPLVLFRRRVQETALAWGVSLDGQPIQIQQLPVQAADGEPLSEAVAAAVQVVDPQGQTWRLVANPDARAIGITLPNGEKWETDARFAVR